MAPPATSAQRPNCVSNTPPFIYTLLQCLQQAIPFAMHSQQLPCSFTVVHCYNCAAAELAVAAASNLPPSPCQSHTTLLQPLQTTTFNQPQILSVCHTALLFITFLQPQQPQRPTRRPTRLNKTASAASPVATSVRL